jgi:hypothetical protein
MDECNNKCKNSNKAQGVKATMRCKGAKVACMKATTGVKVPTRCKGMKVACMKATTSVKVATRCKGMKVACMKVASAKATRRRKVQRQKGNTCKGTRAT